jgi:HEAT repeat protein
MSHPADLLIQKLIDLLDEEDPRTRRNAAGALRLHGRRAIAAVPALEPLLRDQDPAVRGEAERALARLRTPAA